MTPIDILSRAFSYTLLSSRKIPNRPGAVIEKLSSEDRQVLSELKSDDISSDVVPRDQIFGDDAHYRQKEFDKELMAFDAKMKK